MLFAQQKQLIHTMFIKIILIIIRKNSDKNNSFKLLKLIKLDRDCHQHVLYFSSH